MGGCDGSGDQQGDSRQRASNNSGSGCSNTASCKPQRDTQAQFEPPASMSMDCPEQEQQCLQKASSSYLQQCRQRFDHAHTQLAGTVVCCAVLLGALSAMSFSRHDSSTACNSSRVFFNGHGSQVLPLFLALLAAFLLGCNMRMDLSGLTQRRLAASTELLYDLMPQHVADALLKEACAQEPLSRDDSLPIAEAPQGSPFRLTSPPSMRSGPFNRRSLDMGLAKSMPAPSSSKRGRRHSVDTPFLAEIPTPKQQAASSAHDPDSSGDEDKALEHTRGSRPPPRRQVQGLPLDPRASIERPASTSQLQDAPEASALLTSQTQHRNARRCYSLSERAPVLLTGAPVLLAEASGSRFGRPEQAALTRLNKGSSSTGGRLCHQRASPPLLASSFATSDLTNQQQQSPSASPRTSHQAQCLVQSFMHRVSADSALGCPSLTPENSFPRGLNMGTHSFLCDPQPALEDAASRLAAMPAPEAWLATESNLGLSNTLMPSTQPNRYESLVDPGALVGGVTTASSTLGGTSEELPSFHPVPTAPDRSSGLPHLAPSTRGGWLASLRQMSPMHVRLSDEADFNTPPSSGRASPSIVSPPHSGFRLHLGTAGTRSFGRPGGLVGCSRSHAQLSTSALQPCGSGRSSTADEAAQRVALAESHSNVSILFADLCGFTQFSSTMEPDDVFALLNRLFYSFERFLKWFPNIEKLDLIGDCFMAAAGLNNGPQMKSKRASTSSGPPMVGGKARCEITPNDASYHAASMLALAHAILAEAQNHVLPNGEPLQMRVGIHTGPLISGVLGSVRRKYTVLGSTVNIASRLESSSMPGCIHVSEETYKLVAHLPQFSLAHKRTVQLKGIGPMTTYLMAPSGNDSGSSGESSGFMSETAAATSAIGDLATLNADNDDRVTMPVKTTEEQLREEECLRRSLSMRCLTRHRRSSKLAASGLTKATSRRASGLNHSSESNLLGHLWDDLTHMALLDTAVLNGATSRAEPTDGGSREPADGAAPASVHVGGHPPSEPSSRAPFSLQGSERASEVISLSLHHKHNLKCSRAMSEAGVGPAGHFSTPDLSPRGSPSASMWAAVPFSDEQASAPSPHSSVGWQSSTGRRTTRSSKGAILARKLLSGLKAAFATDQKHQQTYHSRGPLGTQ